MNKGFPPVTARSTLATYKIFDPMGSLLVHEFTHRQILQLSFVRGMTASALRTIVEHYKSPERLMTSPPDYFAQARIRSAQYESLLDFGAYESNAAVQLALAEKCGGRVVTYWDEEYPAALREIYNPPSILFVKGNLLPADEHAIAIVGTRGVTEYGRRTAELFARAFAEHGITVVSGLARGVDSFAHGATLRYAGRTIAVIASGLDTISPSLARQLADKIAHSGAIVTEYKMGVKALPSYFPQRNRIISGMSRGTVVIESAVDGGAMITAGFALDQNRAIFAVPGRTTDPKSAGTNLLIKESRAKLVDSPADVLSEFGISNMRGKNTAELPLPALANISLFEKKIMDVLVTESLHIDDIAEAAAMPSNEALVNLLSLELKGYVRQMAGKRFVRE